MPLDPNAPAADPTQAIAQYLKDVPSIEKATEGRVFRPVLPEGQQKFMSRACVIVRSAGGGAMFAKVNYGFTDSRIDVVCYGSTLLEAATVAREVAKALNNLKMYKHEGVAIRWVRVTGQPAAAIDPQTEWKFALVTGQAMHAVPVLTG